VHRYARQVPAGSHRHNLGLKLRNKPIAPYGPDTGGGQAAESCRVEGDHSDPWGAPAASNSAQ